jgi:hypothetical protein
LASSRARLEQVVYENSNGMKDRKHRGGLSKFALMFDHFALMFDQAADL